MRRIRLERALSQEELAARAHVGRTTVVRAEAGLEVRPSSVRKLARALHVDPLLLTRLTGASKN